MISGSTSASSPSLIQQLKAAPRAAFGKNLRQLLANALSRNHADRRRLLPDRIHRSPLDRELQPRRKPHRTQHPQLVLGKPQPRLANRPHQPRCRSSAPTHIIQHAAPSDRPLVIRNRIQQQPIDREVAPQHILARIQSKTAPHPAAARRCTHHHAETSPPPSQSPRPPPSR